MPSLTSLRPGYTQISVECPRNCGNDEVTVTLHEDSDSYTPELSCSYCDILVLKPTQCKHCDGPLHESVMRGEGFCMNPKCWTFMKEQPFGDPRPALPDGKQYETPSWNFTNEERTNLIERAKRCYDNYDGPSDDELEASRACAFPTIAEKLEAARRVK